MRRKSRFFWLKVPNIFPDARRVARIAHTDAHLKNLQWLLIFQLHVQRLCVWRSKYLVLCPSMTVHGLRAGTGAVASRSALNYADFFWNSAIVQLMVLVEKTQLSHCYSSLVCPASASVVTFLFEVCSICPWKGVFGGTICTCIRFSQKIHILTMMGHGFIWCRAFVIEELSKAIAVVATIFFVQTFVLGCGIWVVLLLKL